MYVLSDNEIHGVEFFLELVHLSTLFSKINKRYNKERKHEKERQFLVHMSTLLNNEIHTVAIIILRSFRACPPVHTFCKNKGYKKERKHEKEKQFLVHNSTWPHI